MSLVYDAYRLKDWLDGLCPEDIGKVIKSPNDNYLFLYKGRNIFGQHVVAHMASPQTEYVLAHGKRGYYLAFWDGTQRIGDNIIEPN